MTWLSYSQGSDYAGDAYSAWLGRVMGIPSRPGWSTLAGTAFHEAVEAILLREHGFAKDAGGSVDPTENLDRVVAEEIEHTHGLYTEADVRASKSGKGIPRDGRGADRAWVEKNLPVWMAKWQNWRRQVPWDLALLPDENGEPYPAVEVDFVFEVAPNVKMRGLIDSVWVNRADGTYRVVDWKAGALIPDSPQQLVVYRHALLDKFGADAPYGTFYMAREGVTTEVFDLSAVSREYLSWFYATVADRKEAGDFVPAPSHPTHHVCWYERYCVPCGGAQAHLVAQPWEVGEGRRFEDVPAAREWTRKNLGLPLD